MKTVQPNLVIFRIPDFEGSKTFIEVPLNGTSVDYSRAEEFHVVDGDDYNNLSFGEVVLALATDSGDGSYELARVELTQRDGSPVLIYTDPFELALAVAGIIGEWNDLPD